MRDCADLKPRPSFLDRAKTDGKTIGLVAIVEAGSAIKKRTSGECVGEKREIAGEMSVSATERRLSCWGDVARRRAVGRLPGVANPGNGPTAMKLEIGKKVQSHW